MIIRTVVISGFLLVYDRRILQTYIPGNMYGSVGWGVGVGGGDWFWFVWDGCNSLIIVLS